MNPFSVVTVGGVETARVAQADMVSLMIRDCEKARHQEKAAPKLIFDLNGHGVALAKWDAIFNADLRAADLVHADGQSVVAASRWLTRTAIPERTATTDLFHSAAAAAQRKGLRFYFLGGSEAINAACAAEMQRLYPSLVIAGRRNGYFSRDAEEAICNEINERKVDVLWVGLGKPNEQAFCVRNRDRLKIGWAITCGGCFNYVVGAYPRAPAWMQKLGIEWLHRAATRPRQLAWRYLTTNPVAIYLMLTKTRAASITA